mgnify:FL=1|tara:strand:+ start:22 stop:2667 length:2646 start_codon:yes stop_codon:yes gene_type:complete
MAAVTQRVANYLSGVSKQPDSKKLPGQVRECLNGFPDVTTGLTKRPGFKFLATLKNASNTAYSGTQLDGGKWFYINRGDGDRYIGCVTPKVSSTNGTIKIWNADTGAACTVTDTATSSALGAHSYLTGTKLNYDVLTVHDSTIITNNTVTVTAQSNPTFVASKRGMVILTGTDTQLGSETFSVTVAGQEATYTSQAADGYEEVLTGLKSAIESESTSHSLGLTVYKFGTGLVIDRATAFTLTAKGGKDNKGIVVFQDFAVDASYLPSQSLHGHKVEVLGKFAEDNDNYYAEFVAHNGTSGDGYWKETVGPTASLGFTATTMPHRLLCTATNTFTFGPIPYSNRIVGDAITNKDPQFVGQKIQQAFFYSDRLGFLSDDTVTLSKSQDVFNFYRASVRGLATGDRIGVNATSIRPAVLHAVLPTTQGLVLFSKSQQFLLFSEQGPLTPDSTKIRPISNMEMDSDVDPIDVGTHMNFISKTPNYTRVFAMQTRGLGESPNILDIGRVVNEWITIDVDHLVASVQNDFLAMSSQSSDEIYFYKTYSDGKELLMESWFKWKLPGLVQTIAIDQDDMYSITKQGNQYTLARANLTMSPDASIITNAQGQKINPCIDLYAQATSVAYDSANDFSKCYIPFANLTDQKNVLVVGGTTAAGTFNNSGFTITPETGSDGTGTYFKVPGQDLTSIASNVYVGYAYDFDVELPKLYFNLTEDGRNTDFTAHLTIARCKFDVGLSGVMGFKLKTTGRLAGSKTYTGDGTITDFNWTVGDIDYVDRSQVKVKVNNVTNTAFTFLSDTEIRFSSAPANGSTILIYLDEWYQLQPVTSANTYLADDVPLEESTVFTIPVHQRSKNFNLRVFTDSPFPVSLNSMMWEGTYSPRFYRRT